MKSSLSSLQALGRRGSGWFREFRRRVRAFRDALWKDLYQDRRRREPVTGLRLRRNMLEWTTLREGRHGLEKLAHRRVQLEGEAAVFTEPDKLAAEIRRQCPELTGAISLGLPAEHMLLRVVDLPATDAAEVAGMIKLQLDKFSPFPEDRMAVSYERLHTTAEGCRALVTAARKETIDFATAVLVKAGLDLQRVDADALGWWRVLADQAAAPAAGRQILILLEAEGGIMLAVQDGVPAAIQAVGAPEGSAGEDYAAELAHEIGAFILALDLERGVASVSGLDCWCRDAAPDGLAEKLQARLGQAARFHSLDTLPPLSEGLARRMLRPWFESAPAPDRAAAAVVDLVPPDQRRAEGALRVKRRVIAATILVLGLWLAGGVVFMGGYLWEQRRLKDLERRMAALQKPADEVRAMQRRARAFEQYLDRRRSALECLREISQLLPAEATLTAFQFKKGKSIILRGEALTVNPIYDFKQGLDKSALFKNIDLGSVQPSKRKEATVHTFQITIHLPEEQP